jgi:Zn-finger nucleic acid-binding protein
MKESGTTKLKSGCPRCAGEALEPDGAGGEWHCPSCQGLYLAEPAVTGFVVEELGISWDVLRELPTHHRAGESLACPCGESETSACSLRSVPVDLCLHCGGLWLDAGELYRLSAGSRSTPKGANPKSVDKTAPVRFEVDTLLERSLDLVTVFSLAVLVIAALFEFYASHYDTGPFILGSLGMAFLALALKFSVDHCYFIDPQRRELIDTRVFFGKRTRRRVVCRAAEVTCTTTTAKYHSGNEYEGLRWEYWAVLVTRKGRTFAISSRGERSLEAADEVARQAAELMGVSHLPGSKHQALEVKQVDGRTTLGHATPLWRKVSFVLSLVVSLFALWLWMTGRI